MTTDWVLVRRLGHELERLLRGARVTQAGMLPDGRIGLLLRSRGAPVTVALDPFGSPPVVTVERDADAMPVEPGFVRSLDAAVRGTILTRVSARRGDRLLRMTFSTRSRFGVDDEVELYVELVPRFGNLVLAKGQTVVAAVKEFSPADNARRSVQVGQTYELPPLPPHGLAVPRIVAESGFDAQAFLEYAAGDGAATDPVHVYRRGDLIAAAHLVPLEGFADATHALEPSLLDVLGQAREQRLGRSDLERANRRRNALLGRLDEREQRIGNELSELARKKDVAAQRDALRAEGERIFASLHELPQSQQEEEKERAAALFAKYKKLGAALPHVQERERNLRAALETVRAVRWECERIAVEDLDDVEAAVDAVDGRHRAPAATARRAKKVKRNPLEFRTAAGSRIVVGRSPSENADVTFRLARPNDLWFHAQGIPGAHVILARDDRSEPPPEDIEAAASLAAFYSRGKGSAKVAIDYTARKHVRKQHNAPPGLVWYTNPDTIVAQPRERLTEDELRTPSS